jgi:hypothetical protein
MSSQAKREYNKKYYQENKEILNYKKLKTNGDRAKRMTVVHRLWKEGSLIPKDDEAKRKLEAELAKIDNPPVASEED